MGSSEAVTHEVESPSNEFTGYNAITILVGCDEARFVVHEYYVHLSPILKERCCGSLCDPEEPTVIRLPADNPWHFSQILEALYKEGFDIRIDLGDPPYNSLITAYETPYPLTPNGDVLEMTPAEARKLSEATMRRSQCAVTNLSQVYCLAQKYELNQVQALTLKKLTYYVNPTDYAEGFLWQVAMMYEGKPGASQILAPYLVKALAQIKKRGQEGDQLIQAYIQQGTAFGALIREGYYGNS